MSGNNNFKPVAGPTDGLATLWAQCFELSDRQARSAWEVMQKVCDPQQMQRRWLDAVAQSVENFMRTPAFMEAVKQNLKMMTDLKVFQDQLVKGAARQFGIPLADDISGLFERLNSIERAVLTRLGAVDSRLKAVEATLGSAPAEHYHY
jgi:hypothetical protein